MRRSVNVRKFTARCACCEPSQRRVGDPSRRRFLAGGIAALGFGATAIVEAPAVRAQAAAARPRIDVHHHFVPPVHSDAMATRRSGGRPPRWSAQMSLEDMDRSDIQTAVVSLVQPGTWFGDDVALSRRLGRECNEYGARLMADHPGRFGLFAVISPPDPEGSLKEIEYALDTLKADGIALYTSYGAKYLGDASFEPVYQELNRRKALVYVHPTTPNCCGGNLVPGIGPSTIEYATDSTRTIGHIVFSGTAAKFPDIRWIFSHSGGTLPFLTGRFVRLAQERKLADPMPAFARFYYELAQGNTPGQIAALLKMVPISQVLYGTDFPFRDGAEVNAGIAAYGFAAGDVRAIEREVAWRLIPRLKPA
jgi:predicted TIM-barrel fold metal-dependent hydrolase